MNGKVVALIHLAGCSCAEPDWEACPASKDHKHSWSKHRWANDWDWNWCWNCPAIDLRSICITRHCECVCHGDYWEGHEAAVAKPHGKARQL